MALIAGSILLPVAILLGASFLSDLHMSQLLRDTTVVAAKIDDCCTPSVGALSTLGLLVMSAGAAFFALGALMRAYALGIDTGARLLAIGAVFSVLFCLDDAFLLHEHVLKNRGIPEIALYVVYGALLLSFIWTGRRHLPYLEPILLVLTVLGFGVSVGLDQVLPSRPVIEDSFKFIGIFTWFGFALVAAGRLARGALSQTQ